MDTEVTTIKVWVGARKLLRLISAMTGETILEVVHRIAGEEWNRLQRNDQSAQDQINYDN